MTSPAQIAANRQNALKSTGPKTAEGKTRASMNALRHGAAAESVVVPYLEDTRDWEAHRAGTLESLTPVGHLETVLAERVASLLWRLGRAARYEREVVACEQETVERDELRFEFHTTELDDLRHALASERRALRLLNSLHDAPADRRVSQDAALGLLYAVCDEAEEFDLEEHSLEPCVPDDVPTIEFDSWTCGLVRRSVEIVADHEGRPVKEFYEAAKSALRLAELKAKITFEKAAARVDRARRQKLLPNRLELEKVSRYEAHLDRALYKALHELQRLQAARAGKDVPLPAAVDITGDGPHLRPD